MTVDSSRQSNRVMEKAHAQQQIHLQKGNVPESGVYTRR